MGRKRRSNEDPEYLRSKIRLLESKLMHKSGRRIRIFDSSDSDCSDDNGPVAEPPREHTSRRASRNRRSQRSPSPRSVSPAPALSHQDQVPSASSQPGPSTAPDLPQPIQAAAQKSRDSARALSPQPGPSSAPDLPQPLADDPVQSSPEDIELDEGILNLLGDAPKTDTPLGKAIHKDVASRWQEVLHRGLQKELKEKLEQEYLVPINCDLLFPPILNPEAKAALPDALIRRDTSLMLRQKQIGLALSALAQATEILIKQKSSAPEVIKPLSDACRILCDSHFTETKLRRNFVISAINTDLKDTLINTQRDKFLFGENVSDKLKAAQTVQRSGSTLKNTQKPYNPFNKANFTLKNRNQNTNFNYNTQHRKTTNQSRSDAGRGRAARPAPASRYNSRYRAKERERERSPPRRHYRR